MEDWRTALIAGEIWGRPHATNEQTVLNVVMPKVETVLKSGAPASMDFTLHDDGHGFRVAEMAAKLIGETVTRLSALELSLLLIASYCHDIGMSPSRERIGNHFKYLLTGDRSLLSNTAIHELQSWLDSNRNGLTAPVEQGTTTAAGIDVVDDAIAYYSRSRHNDWGEDFIRTELSNLPVNLYPGWIEDLVILCRSHHDGIAELRNSRFDAKNVGSPSSVVNLRFLAAILRVADVLEFAPERTPAIILRQRSIAPNSRVFWFKDHSISFVIDEQSKRMIFSARTPTAYIHRAAIETADAVNDELALCALLEQEAAFARGVILPEDRSIYSWHWPSRLTTDIQELPDSFTYIEGEFRPDSRKILNLLSGTALYGEPIFAVRELVQNALDAIREQIAYSRITSSNPADDQIAERLAHLHTVTITLSRDDGSYWLSCTDDGSGMTKSIIERHLLVSGSGTRGETRSLIRSAEAHGFSVERTGRFGIGVLSYFMIANELRIITRRSQEAGDIDGTAWKFTTDGLDGFGELTRETRASKGTAVSLRLKDGIVSGSPKQWFDKLHHFIRDTFCWSPCKIIVRNEVEEVERHEQGPGWTFEPASYGELLLGFLMPDDWDDHEFQTAAEAMRYSEEHSRDSELQAWAGTVLRWTPPVESVSSSTKAALRASLPYFVLEGGASRNLLDVREYPRVRNARYGWARSPRVKNTTSLHGVEVPATKNPISDCLVDIDLRGGSEIMVDRQTLSGPLPAEVAEEAEGARQALWRQFLTDSRDSIFNEINVASSPLSYQERAAHLGKEPAWCIRGADSSDPVIAKVTYPVLSVARTSFYTWRTYAFYSGNCDVEAVRLEPISEHTGMALHDLYGGGRVVHQAEKHGSRTRSGVVGIQWDNADELLVLDGTVASAASKFPDEWADIAAIRTEHRLIFNRDHSLVRKAPERKAPKLKRVRPHNLAERMRRSAADRGTALDLVLRLCSFPHRSLVWIHENARPELEALLRAAGFSDSETLVVLDASEFSEAHRSTNLSAIAFEDRLVDYDIPEVGESSELLSSQKWESK